ncbi:hypothetical protein BC351_20215 [Paenibacillus ferrarius]|uniref:Uncharacterized protein n=1 Tax=Paenibacillus ferrarius TaxID=1469647 RepID=A0A1V4HN38_9BACL|nr:hypothetical protein [Paenibacillus ferrarius]OPH59245.1 hypothetical protein BC351_20215 [Paenibacillus ferrarius]
MTESRFNDKGKSVYDFLLKSDGILIECPYCLKCAKGIRTQNTDFEYKLSCSRCGILTNATAGSSGYGTFMGINLWLKTNCCGNLLWAYNKEHLDFLDNYITSSLRERIPNRNQSLASRLPEWIKSRKNREELAKGIEKLRSRIEQCK